MKFQRAAQLIFGRDGNVRPSQLEGFGAAEDGFTWAMGPSARLRVGIRPGQGDLMLELSQQPFMAPPRLTRQRFGITVNGRVAGMEWAQHETLLGFRLPQAALRGCTELDLTFDLPDADSPRALGVSDDSRMLGFMMRAALLSWVPPEAPLPRRRLPPLPGFAGASRAALEQMARYMTGLSLPDLALHFESLGHNCEFGLVQRECGAEPQSLLRFAGITMDRLWQGLQRGFEGVDDAAQLDIFAGVGAAPEWLMRHAFYGMPTHSFQAPESITADALRAQFVTRLGFQRRNLLEILHSGEKLFVFQQPGPMSVAQALPLLTRLRDFGPNALLFVSETDARPSGSVDQLGAHLFRGNIARLAPISAADTYDFAAWISLCANAYRLWRETGHGNV